MALDPPDFALNKEIIKVIYYTNSLSSLSAWGNKILFSR